MKNHILLQVFLSMALAVFAGLLTGPEAEILGVTWVRIFDLIGNLFLNALTLVVVPLVVSSIISGTARMGKDESFGSMGIYTFGYFILTALLAIGVGLTLVVLMKPGVINGQGGACHLLSEISLDEFTAHAKGDTFDKIKDLMLRIIPQNVFRTASEGSLIGMIVFSLAFGFFIPRIQKEASITLLNFWQGVFEVMMSITRLVMYVLPIGVFGLVAKVVATTGIDTFECMIYFFLTAVAAMAIHLLITLSLLLKGVAKRSPIQHLRDMAPAVFTAFSVSSSAATLPVTLECAEKRAGISNRICSFTIPLGTSINLQATGLYCCISVIFIAQAYGIELSMTSYALILLMSLFSTMGMVAGIPSSSLVTIVIILQTLGLPKEGVALILATERILDMSRGAVNVYGNSCVAALISKKFS